MIDASVMPTAMPARLLLVETHSALGPAIAAPVEAEFGCAPIVVELTAGRQAIELMRGSVFDVVVADLEALADIGERLDERVGRMARVANDAIIVVISTDASISAALEAMRAGAHDCIGHECHAAMLAARIGTLARRHGKGHMLAQSGSRAGHAVGPEPTTPAIPVMRDLVLPMWRQEQRIIESAIQSFAGNVALAAAALELSPSTIYRKRQAWAEMDAKRA